ncbi:MAG: DASH family cryptochrome [Bacteroidia bacterium]|nr:DASH family cryptochrome [Bacteroidia bacterium]MDW8134198.1 DASH family cryptochrome [Bacteroidia bacterium]
MYKRVALWVLNDLRLHDHPALAAALRNMPQEVRFVYVWGPPSVDWGEFSFPPNWPLGLPRISQARQRFLLESLLDLAQRIHLEIVFGEPHKVLVRWAQERGIEAIYGHREWAPEEVAYQQATEASLREAGIPLFLYEGNALYERDQLPFPIQSLPRLFTRFRQLVEQAVAVKPPLPAPANLPSIPQVSSQTWLKEKLHALPPLSPLGFPFKGGERAGQQRVREYFAGPVFSYKQTRNSLLGWNFSSHFSPWLALGCLSPRWVYAELREAEKKREANESTYWLFFELLWREYFRWLMACWGRKIFAAGGIHGYKLPWKREEALLRVWIEGRTGYPIVDAAMRELATTGWTSNRARQIVASFFTKNLFLDWRWGAAYFETQLIDYDVYSNWGNWLYQAGVGTDGRGFRWFDPLRQAKLYDPSGSFIHLWIPELKGIAPPRLFMPEPALRLRHDYPQPVVDWSESLKYAKDTYWRAVKGMPKGNQLLKLFQEEE